MAIDSPAPFAFADSEVAPGKRAAFELPISRVSAGQTVSLPVRIVHGKQTGPVLFVSAAIHGDEITGVEIVRRLLRRVKPQGLSGTLLAVPIVNVYGFIANGRYLPDRRDLNRSFPGTKTGSLASQLAHMFTTEIIERADFGIDLHSAAIHRVNLPQIRISPDSPRAGELAAAFGAPAIITSPLRDNSLRKVALEAGVEMLLYEAGEGLRFDEFSIRTGVQGILRVMEAMEMLAPLKRRKPPPASLHAERSLWVRAPRGGLYLAKAKAGDIVHQGERIATLANPVGEDEDEVIAPIDGLVIGQATLPIVNRGDALFHIAQIAEIERAADRVDAITDAILSDRMLDEDEVV